MAAGVDTRAGTGRSWAHVAALLAVVIAVTLAIDPIASLMPDDGARAWLQVAAYAVLVAVTLGLALGLERRGWRSLGVEGGRIGWQAGWGGLLLVVLVLAFIALPIAVGLAPAEVLGLAPTSAGQAAALIAFDIVCVGFGEELVFRGYLLDRFTGLLRSGVIAAIVTAILFGAWHLLASGNAMQCLITAAIGLILGLARVGLPHCTTLSVALAHGCYDAAIVLGALWLT